MKPLRLVHLVCTMIVVLAIAPANAQFAYECSPTNGREYISKTPCPAGVTWRKVMTDPYYQSNTTSQSAGEVAPTPKKQDPVVSKRQQAIDAHEAYRQGILRGIVPKSKQRADCNPRVQRCD